MDALTPLRRDFSLQKNIRSAQSDFCIRDVQAKSDVRAMFDGAGRDVVSMQLSDRALEVSNDARLGIGCVAV